MNKDFYLTLYWACDYLSMLELKLNHVSKRVPLLQEPTGPCINATTNLPCRGILMLKMRWLHDSLIFIFGTHVFVRRHFSMNKPWLLIYWLLSNTVCFILVIPRVPNAIKRHFSQSNSNTTWPVLGVKRSGNTSQKCSKLSWQGLISLL